MEDKKEAPFSEEEALIMHLLAEAWNAFLQDREYPPLPHERFC